MSTLTLDTYKYNVRAMHCIPIYDSMSQLDSTRASSTLIGDRSSCSVSCPKHRRTQSFMFVGFGTAPRRRMSEASDLRFNIPMMMSLHDRPWRHAKQSRK